MQAMETRALSRRSQSLRAPAAARAHRGLSSIARQPCSTSRPVSSVGSPAIRTDIPSRRHVTRAAAMGELPPMKIPELPPLKPEEKLTIGIVGFGLFGQFLAKRMVMRGHRVLATSRSPYHEEAAAMGVEYFTDGNDFCEEHPDVVILVTSILSTETVIDKLPMMRLKRSTLIVDVLSVKVFPKQLMLEKLDPGFDILCTHPMFGPNSGGFSWEGLNYQFEKVRIGDDPQRQQRVDSFLKFFANEGCNMVEMTCEDHDYMAASTQFITHTVGRMLGTLNLKATPIDTKGFEALLTLVKQTNTDSFDLYYGLFLYNQNATDELERLEAGLEKVKKGLFGRLHTVAREALGTTAGSPPSSLDTQANGVNNAPEKLPEKAGKA